MHPPFRPLSNPQSIFTVVRRPLAFAVVALVVLAPGGLQAQQRMAPQSPDQVATAAFNEGMNAFNAGDFAKAVQQLESFFQIAPADVVSEAPFFTIASAYFNTQAYDKAAGAYVQYLEKFPQGQRVNEAQLGLALSMIKNDQPDKAIEPLQKIEQVPALREQSLLLQGKAWGDAGQAEKSVEVLERLTGKPVKLETLIQAEGAMMLAEGLVKLGKWEETEAVLDVLRERPEAVENQLRLNVIILGVGDHYLESSEAAKALKQYRQARLREDILVLQRQRITALEKRLKVLETQARIPAFASKAGEAGVIREELNEARAALVEFEKLPDFDESVWLRLGRAYYDEGRPWEAYLVLRHVLEKYPQSTQREMAMASMIFSMTEIVPAAETQEWCTKFLQEFPKSEQAAAIGYLSGAVALQHGDYLGAETYFGRMLEEQPQSERRGEMIYLLGNAQFLQGKFPDARARYDLYLKEFPAGEYAEEIQCRRALSFIYSGEYEPAATAFNEYLAKYPKGDYAPEAKYRLAVIDYAGKQFDKVIAACEEWAKAYPGDALQAENYALLGDACVATDRIEEAADAYGKAVEAAQTEEVTQYALMEAQKMYQKTGQWDKVAELFQNFIKAHPDSPLVVTSLYWVGRAKEKLGQPDEAREYTVENIKTYLNDQRYDAVEQLLQLYAQLAVRKKMPASADGAAPAPRDLAAIEKEISDALSGTKGEKPVARARILYTQAEAARLRRNPSRVQELQAKIAGGFKPEELSAPLLVLSGEEKLKAGDKAGAKADLELLRDDFPKSPYSDAADAGLGRLALEAGQYEEAEKLYRAAVAKQGLKLPDALVGLGRALVGQNKLDEAEKVFQQVAATKNWRGERTAESLYYLGEIDYQRGRYAEANALFQRVFVSWRKYPSWVARSYLKSADCFLKLDKKPEAVRTWQEMLRQENLARLPETETARTQLETHEG